MRDYGVGGDRGCKKVEGIFDNYSKLHSYSNQRQKFTLIFHHSNVTGVPKLIQHFILVAFNSKRRLPEHYV